MSDFERTEAEALRALLFRGTDSAETRAYSNAEFQQLMTQRWPKGIWVSAYGFMPSGQPAIFRVRA